MEMLIIYIVNTPDKMEMNREKCQIRHIWKQGTFKLLLDGWHAKEVIKSPLLTFIVILNYLSNNISHDFMVVKEPIQ